MAEETASNLTGKRVSTTFRGLLHFPKSIDPSLSKQVVYDGNGTPTALTLGGDTIGMDISGPLACTGNLSANSNVIIEGDITLIKGGNINDVSVLSSGSSVSLRASSAAEVGKLRIRETPSDYELLFGNPTVADKNLFSIIVKNDNSSNLYIKNNYSDVDINSPLWINRATGEVNIKVINTTKINTVPPPGTSPPPGQPETYGDPNRNVLPVGMICMFPALGIPSGWIACDGKKHDKRSLPELFAVIGYNYSVLKTGNDFQVPDYRGLFVRGVDYKRGDEPSHTFLDPSGARNLDGTVQNDELRSHSHTLNNVLTYPATAEPRIEQQQEGPPDGDFSMLGGSGTGTFGGAETRPKNVVALYCIKW
jgi:microcystin-dependent protein